MGRDIKKRMEAEARIKKDIEYDFLYGDADSFMKHFDIDEVNKFHTRKWFESYALVFDRPQNCHVQIDSMQSSVRSFSGVIKIHLDYMKYDSEVLLLYFVWDHEKDVIISSKFTVQNAFDTIYKTGVEELSFHAAGDFIEEETEQKDLKEAEDPLEPRLYARILIKSMRYRMTNPEINSAALLSDCMSYQNIKFAKQLKNKNLTECLYALNKFAKKYIEAKTDPETGGEKAVSPKEQALLSMKSLDDSFYEIKKQGSTKVNCLENISFYLSTLQLIGIEISDYYVIVQPFHFIAIVSIDKDMYLISFNDLISMTESRLYGDSSVQSIFNPFMFYNLDMGVTNMSKQEISGLKAFFTRVPVFPIRSIPEEKYCKEKETDTLPSYKQYESADRLCRAIRKYVFEKSRIQPDSVFTWAKYAYQLLDVKKPQAYIISGFLSKIIQDFSKNVTDITELLQWIKENLDIGSIFSESDRIMTAEQVFTHGTAADHDLALFFYTVLTAAKRLANGGIIMTSDTSYVIGSSGGSYHIWNMRGMEEDKTISGQILVAFNETTSYNYKFDSADEIEKLQWLDAIKKS